MDAGTNTHIKGIPPGRTGFCGYEYEHEYKHKYKHKHRRLHRPVNIDRLVRTRVIAEDMIRCIITRSSLYMRAHTNGIEPQVRIQSATSVRTNRLTVSRGYVWEGETDFLGIPKISDRPDDVLTSAGHASQTCRDIITYG